MRRRTLFGFLIAIALASIWPTAPAWALTQRREYIPAKENQQRSSEEKLINSEDIMGGFEKGLTSVKVIVNLAKPSEVLEAVNWNSPSSLNVLHAEILARQKQVLNTLSDVQFTLRNRFENQAGFSGEITRDGLDKLLNDPRVESIEPVYIVEKHLAQGIPLINGMVHRSTYNGQGVAIAICDDGIDYTHSKLGGGGFPNSKVIGGYDFGDTDANPFPSCSSAHGTLCTGIAAGDLGTTGDYIGGVAHGAKLYALKVENSSGIIWSDKVIASWDWCVSHKNDNSSYPILVISTSLGGGRYFSTCDGSESAYATAANNAVAAGITVLVSSGNEGYCSSMSSPACLSNTISVGAVYDAAFGTYCFCVKDGSCASSDSCISCGVGQFSTTQVTGADVVTVYSNTASFLDVLAPSHDAYTTDIAGSCGYSTGDYYPYFGGTSAACPYAAGVVACLQSAAKVCTGSYLSPSQVRSILTSTGDPVTDDKVAITKPRVNLGQAIDSLCGAVVACSVIEDFETGDFTKARWLHSGNANWAITSLEKNAGTYSAKAGAITHNQSSILEAIVDCNVGNVTFYRKVSSELGYDYLTFYIDGVEKNKWSGTQNWAQVSFPVTAGTRTFKWTYSKDGSVSSGFDTAWIDDIEYPIDCRDCNAMITIGTDTSTWAYPMHTYYHDSRTQVIYLAGEIGMSAAIGALALDVTTVPSQTMNNWTIRMKHTGMSSYGTASLDANSSGWTVVYHANEPAGSTGWRTFTFPTPFEYNGSDNLLVDFSHNNTSYTSNGDCTSSSPGGTRSAYAYSDSVYGDPLNWSGTSSPTVYGSSKVPDIQLSIVCIPGDFDNNGAVDLADFTILGSQWRQPHGSPSADIAPEIPDGFVDIWDLAASVENWLEGANP